MRRIDAIAITFAFFAVGGIAFLILQSSGLKSDQAGIWSQVVLVAGLLIWLSTYAFRAINHKMTYSQQLDTYREAVMKKRLEEMSPEELTQLQAEVEAEKAQKESG